MIIRKGNIVLMLYIKKFERYFGLLLILIGGMILLFGADIQITSDGLIRYNALMNLINNGHLEPIKYSYIGPIFSIPLYYAGIEIKYFNIIILFVALIFSAFIMKDVFSSEFIMKFILLTLVGSMFTANTRDFFSETFSSSTLFVGILLLILNKYKILSILLVSLSVVTNTVLIVPVSLIALYFIFKERKVGYVFYILNPILIIGLENFLKFGSVLNQAYSNNHGFHTLMPYSGLPNFSYPLFFGILSILFSFGKGLVFFTPAIFLQVHFDKKEKFMKAIYIISAVIGICLILIYSKWWAWYGGVCWGPRFFLFLSFMNSFVLAFFLTKSSINYSIKKVFWIVLVLVLSLWVGYNGHIFEDSWFNICRKDSYAWEPLQWYTTDYSVLWYPFVFTDFFSKEYNQMLFIYYIVTFVYLLKTFLAEYLSIVIQILYTKFNKEKK